MVGNNSNLTFCEAQLKRFSAFWRLDDVALAELLNVLVVSAESQAQAEAWVSRRLLESSEWPKPADFARYATEFRDEKRAQVPWKPDPPPPSDGRTCRACGGWGCVQLNGKWQYCTCADARDLHLKVPGYIDFCNSLKAAPAGRKKELRHASEVMGAVIANIHSE